MRPFLIWAVSDISIFFSLCVINYGKHFCEIWELNAMFYSYIKTLMCISKTATGKKIFFFLKCTININLIWICFCFNFHKFYLNVDYYDIYDIFC